jgi:NADH oxidase (H2O2-forming)
MKYYDILIIGGGPAGVTCALSAKNTYPQKSIAIIRKENQPMIPCGIPYIIQTLNDIMDNILPDMPLKNNKIDIIIEEVVERKENTIKLSNSEEITFEKLVIAVGAKVIKPKIDGIEKEGVFLVKKEKDYLQKMKLEILKSKKIIVLGAGYIGVEITDELVKAGKDVTLIEMMDSILPTMDKEFGEKAREIIEKSGGKILTGKTITKITGDKKIEGVLLNDGTSLDAECLISACGYKPDDKINSIFNVNYEKGKGIIVDEYLKTNEKNIFAIGDCAQKNDFLTNGNTNTLLASTAMMEGRLTGSNLYSIKAIRKFKGVLGTFSTKISNTAFAVSGLTEIQAKKHDIDYTIGMAKSIDRHPGKLPNASEISVKLIFSTYSHVLLGGEIMGGDSIGEMINMISSLILNKMTDMDINNLQIGTHPLLTSSPIGYPVLNATTDAIRQWYK